MHDTMNHNKEQIMPYKLNSEWCTGPTACQTLSCLSLLCFFHYKHEPMNLFCYAIGCLLGKNALDGLSNQCQPAQEWNAAITYNLTYRDERSFYINLQWIPHPSMWKC